MTSNSVNQNYVFVKLQFKDDLEHDYYYYFMEVFLLNAGYQYLIFITVNIQVP